MLFRSLHYSSRSCSRSPYSQGESSGILGNFGVLVKLWYAQNMTPRDVLQRCPLCHVEYGQDAVTCIDAGPVTGKPRLYHCACGSCKRSMVALLVESTGWLSSVGMLTELTADEARTIPVLSPVSGDHCVAIHEMLLGDGMAFFEKLTKKA